MYKSFKQDFPRKKNKREATKEMVRSNQSWHKIATTQRRAQHSIPNENGRVRQKSCKGPLDLHATDRRGTRSTATAQQNGGECTFLKKEAMFLLKPPSVILP